MPGVSIVAGAVQHRVIDIHTVGVCREVVSIKIDDVAEHRIAAFFSVKGQHLTDAACLAEGKVEILGVIAVVHPDTGSGLNDLVDDLEDD